MRMRLVICVHNDTQPVLWGGEEGDNVFFPLELFEHLLESAIDLIIITPINERNFQNITVNKIDDAVVTRAETSKWRVSLKKF